VKDEIKKFFKGDADDSRATLAQYSRDASVFEVRPKLVLYPRDSEDVQNLVKWSSDKENVSITARCAGTDMSGGSIGESIILDFTRYMNKLVGGPLPLEDGKNKKSKTKFGNYPAVPSYISVEPGMFYRDFEKITLEKGLILPCYTASKSINAIGGMFGNNSAGERTLKYGKTEDYILKSKVVFTDGKEYEVKPLSRSELDKKMAQGDFEGNIYKNIFSLISENQGEIERAKPAVHKNSAGYYIWNVMKDNVFDLNKVLVGSQGTLGIMTEVTLKIIPENKNSKLVVIFMNDLAPLGRLVGEILTQNPETLETYDDKTMKLAVRFFPAFLKSKGLFGMIKFMLSFLPEFFMMVSNFLKGGGGFPKLIVLAEFAGESEKIVHEKCVALREHIKIFKLKTHITKSEAEAEKYWDIRRESFALLRKHIKGMHTAPFIDDVIVRPEFLPKFLPELDVILEDYKGDLIYTLAGHAGDGNFHIIPLMDFSRPNTAKIIVELSGKVFDLVMKYRGSITAEHNDGLIRTPYLRDMYGESVVAIFRKIKEIFDPKNIFNPGKKVPMSAQGSVPAAGTKEYIASHIAREQKAEHKS
jgi:FAD/FMN-containing dehydrogenase